MQPGRLTVGEIAEESPVAESMIWNWSPGCGEKLGTPVAVKSERCRVPPSMTSSADEIMADLLSGRPAAER